MVGIMGSWSQGFLLNSARPIIPLGFGAFSPALISCSESSPGRNSLMFGISEEEEEVAGADRGVRQSSAL